MAWLALLLLLPATPVASEGLMPEVWLEADFETDRKLVVELRVATGGGLAGDRLPGGAEDAHQFPAQLPAGTRHQHRAGHGLGPSSGPHQSRLSRYQATVASRPSSNPRCGDQPRSRMRVVSIE